MDTNGNKKKNQKVELNREQLLALLKVNEKKEQDFDQVYDLSYLVYRMSQESSLMPNIGLISKSLIYKPSLLFKRLLKKIFRPIIRLCFYKQQNFNELVVILAGENLKLESRIKNLEKQIENAHAN